MKRLLMDIKSIRGKMKHKSEPIEKIDWKWMRCNLHEVGFEKLIETINLLVEFANKFQKELDQSKKKD